MRIAIYIGALPTDKEKWSLGHLFIYKMVSYFLAAHPEAHFFILSDEPVTALFEGNRNVEFSILEQARPFILSHYRNFHYKLSALLRHADAEVWVSMQGVLPLKGKIPSCLFLSDDLISNRESGQKSGLDRYRMRRLQHSLRRVDQIVTLSKSGKQQLKSLYLLPEHRIRAVGRGISELFHPLDWKTREKVKEQYADGKEFLLYRGKINAHGNLLNLLKGFSILKKKMNSGMVLVLAGQPEQSFKKFSELLQTYYFRKDVRITGEIGLKDTAALTGSAYAQIISSPHVDFSSSIPEAFRCWTPVVAAKSPLHEEIGGEAALYFEASSFNELGEQLCELYKKEELRGELIARADQKIQAYSWERAATRFWEAIRSAATATEK